MRPEDDLLLQAYRQGLVLYRDGLRACAAELHQELGRRLRAGTSLDELGWLVALRARVDVAVSALDHALAEAGADGPGR